MLVRGCSTNGKTNGEVWRSGTFQPRQDSSRNVYPMTGSVQFSEHEPIVSYLGSTQEQVGRHHHGLVGQDLSTHIERVYWMRGLHGSVAHHGPGLVHLDPASSQGSAFLTQTEEALGVGFVEGKHVNGEALARLRVEHGVEVGPLPEIRSVYVARLVVGS